MISKRINCVALSLIVLSTISVIVFWSFYPKWRKPEEIFNVLPDHYGHKKLLLDYSVDSTSSSSGLMAKGYPISKDVVIHSVHYDDRSRKGHGTIVLFFLEVKTEIFKNNLIVKCGSEQQETKNFKAHKDFENILVHSNLRKTYPYLEIVLECYDLSFEEGDHGFVWYKTDEKNWPEEDLLVTSSEEQIVIPAPRIQPSSREHDITILTCTKIHNNKVTYVSEFIRYQETIGIDHIHITILDTFVRDGGLQKLITTDSYFRNAINRKYITIHMFREWYEESDVYTHATSLMQMDCYYRHRGTYDYVFVSDTDDFYTPMMLESKNIKDLVLKFCHKPDIGSCRFKWITYYPEACGLTTKEIPKDGNITAYLKSHSNNVEFNAKSLHLTNALVDSSFHDAKCDECLIDGFKVFEVPKTVAYVAHIRDGQKPQQRC